MTKDYGLDCMPSVDQVFYKRGVTVAKVLFAAKVDEFIIDGIQDTAGHFIRSVDHGFTLGQVKKDRELKFLGCLIWMKTKGRITLKMDEYAQRMEEISIQKCRQLDTSQRASDDETRDYRSMAAQCSTLVKQLYNKHHLLHRKCNNRLARYKCVI